MIRPLAHGYVFRTSPLMNVYGSDFSHVQGFGVRDRYFQDFDCRAAGAKFLIYTRHPYAENNSRVALDSVSTAKILPGWLPYAETHFQNALDSKRCLSVQYAGNYSRIV